MINIVVDIAKRTRKDVIALAFGFLLVAIFLCYLGNSLVGQLTSCLQAVERMGSEQSWTWSTSLRTGIDRAAKIASNWIV